MNKISPIRALGFLATPEHKCSYLPGKMATTLFADPHFPLTRKTYRVLLEHGFRRSGEHAYKPRCEKCRACVSVRVAVQNFQASRGQRRTLKKNQDVEFVACESVFRAEHYALYNRYMSKRHSGSDMEASTAEQYIDFLTCSWADTRFYEMRIGSGLAGVAIVDVLADSLSAVYTFFDPAYSARSLGRLAVLKEIAMAKQLGLRWLYLGYWIAQCSKMSYKNEYQPLQYFSNDGWIDNPESC